MTRTLLTGGLVFDGTGAPPAQADVLVEGGRIIEVGPGLDGDEAVDVAGRHLLPGLFDCHTHVTLTSINLLGIVQTPFSYRFYETVQNLRATLAAGITMVRDAAGADVVKVATSGGVLSPTDDPRHAHFRDDELTALVTEAAAAGRWVMAHAQAADGVKAALRAGVRSIEHGVYLDDEAIELLLAREAWLVPTLVAPRGVLAAAEAGVPIPDASRRKAVEVAEAHADSFRRAVAAGVRVAMGTDSGVTPHGRNLAELELMAKGGMTPAQVLAATTSSAAELLGVAGELGTLEPGKRADVVVVDGDPFELATLPERIAAVVQDGRLVSGHV
ncbi:MAG: metal-dependent hydrolase [Actinomycetia bacterium]|nr:metal-dependent hydrolase [Actinomycetes bacterium]